MDERLAMEAHQADLVPDSVELEEASAEFVGRWDRLVSTTNWEKGRIISEWRMRLMEEEAPAQTYSDEAWSRRVGNVSGQHVGRLRRVFEKFGEVYQQYPGLYWSHFSAAMDWPDAEMWLEGAVQNGWSISQMRTQRWEAIGAPADKKPREEDIIVAELDEDAGPAIDSDGLSETLDQSVGVVRDPDAEPTVESHRPEPPDSPETSPPDALEKATDLPAAPEPVRPFEDLPPLPDDLAEALEAFKLAILNHKLSGWRDVSRDDILLAIEALRQLALAPTGS